MLKTAVVMLCAIAAASTAPAASAAPPASAAPAAVLAFGRFGEVTVYRAEGTPARDVVLFLSGDGGWNLGVISMARRLTDKGAVVAGIDTRHYLAQLEKSTDNCVSPAVELENLSRYLQSMLGLKDYLQPTLIGYSSGATLAYAALVQAPDGLFKGALSIGFCPDLDLKKPLCKGSGIEAAPRRDARGVLKGRGFSAGEAAVREMDLAAGRNRSGVPRACDASIHRDSSRRTHRDVAQSGARLFRGEELGSAIRNSL